MQLPILDTARLRLMALRDQQAARLAELGNDPLIEAFTASMPSPYTLETAHAFIERSALAIERNENCVFGIHLRSNELVGVLNLRLQERHRSGHMGYWMGAAFRNRGLTTEAVREAVQFGFQTLQLNRIHTSCMAENHASARVLEKAGFEREGCSRQAFFKNGIFHDLLQFGAIAEHWQTR